MPPSGSRTPSASSFDSAMQKPLTIVHTSDVHLDSRDTDTATNGFRSRAERAFAGVVDTTLDVDADLFLIAGDLFDNNRVDDSNIDFVYGQFGRLDCAVVMLPGNHDVHDEGSVWNRFDFDVAGDHVHGLMDHDGDCVTLDDIGTRVWGKAMAEHAPENYPLAGTPARHDRHWNIGMAHGQVVERRVSQGSSPITREEIRTSGFDYLALGHIHVWADHSEGETIAFYSGSPVAHFAGANGGHVAVVNLCPNDGISVESRIVSSWERAMERSNGGFPF